MGRNRAAVQPRELTGNGQAETETASQGARVPLPKWFKHLRQVGVQNAVPVIRDPGRLRRHVRGRLRHRVQGRHGPVRGAGTKGQPKRGRGGREKEGKG